jgi:hypothetical protein
VKSVALVAVLCVVSALAPSVGRAQAVYTHAVQSGDTLASIAQRYYGDPTREAVLREANRMKSAGENGLLPGSWLFIPVVTFYRVGPDETWKSISARFYGDPGRAAALIEANEGNRRVQPDEGAELLVFVDLEHDDAAVVSLGREHQVDGSDQSVVDERQETGDDLAGEVVLWKADEEVFQRGGHASSLWGSGSCATAERRCRHNGTTSRLGRPPPDRMIGIGPGRAIGTISSRTGDDDGVGEGDHRRQHPGSATSAGRGQQEEP